MVDYVTEKFFETLQADTVPVYLGAPNVEDYAIGEHSFIRADQFNTTEDLVDYLIYLDQNDEKYQKYFEWKKKPMLETGIRAFERGAKISPCRICKKVAELLSERDDDL